MIVERAQVADVMAWATASGFPLPRLHYKSIVAQVVVSEAYVMRDVEGGDPVSIVGCLDLEPGRPGEIFFIAPPGGLGRKLVPVCVIARRHLAVAALLRPAGLICWVRVDNSEGQRLARCLGFQPTDVGTDWRMWRFAHEQRREADKEFVRQR
jgi:hypothetical protein